MLILYTSTSIYARERLASRFAPSAAVATIVAATGRRPGADAQAQLLEDPVR
jgi:hypothetical protein